MVPRKHPIKLVYLGGGRYLPYRVIDAIKLVKYLIKANRNFEIDFINKNEHDFIENILVKEKIPQSFYKIKTIGHEAIYDELPKYDIGLVFLEKGYWIRMSSPTKIREYLAAGLLIIGNEGISILNRMASESENILLLKRNGENLLFCKGEIDKLLGKVKNKDTRRHSKKLAAKYFSLEKANEEYEKVYKLLMS